MSNFVTSTSHKSRKTALLLCIFLGIFGVHNFYVGRYGRGLLFMLTVGFFYLVGFLILSKYYWEILRIDKEMH